MALHIIPLALLGIEIAYVNLFLNPEVGPFIASGVLTGFIEEKTKRKNSSMHWREFVMAPMPILNQ
jgi:hypothetical protein